MPHRMLTGDELAAYLHLRPDDVARLLRESDIPYTVRGGRSLFRRSEIDAWASRRILGLPPKRLEIYHEKTTRGTRDELRNETLIPELAKPAYIRLDMRSKTRASIIRDMASFAAETGRVHDPKELAESVAEREAQCSTALPGGIAILHARHQAPYRFDDSFLLLGRTIQGIPFGSADGRNTRLFFFLCCDNDRIHLHALARIALLVQRTAIVERLLEVETSDAAFETMLSAESEALRKP